jgi:hypothetical protein
MERTSSTSIQKSLVNEQQYLNDNKIYYLHTEKINCVDAAIALGTNPVFDFFDVYNIKNIKILEKLKSEIISNFKLQLSSIYKQNKYDVCIISSEHFGSRLINLNEIKSFRKILQEFYDEIEIILFKRSKEDFIKSLYSSALCNGHDIGFVDFSKNVINDPRYFPVDTIISKWRSVFDDNVKVMDFDLDVMGKSPVNMVLQSIKSDLKIEENLHINKRMSRRTLSILRQINRYFPKHSRWDTARPSVFIGNALRSIVLRVLN